MNITLTTEQTQRLNAIFHIADMLQDERDCTHLKQIAGNILEALLTGADITDLLDHAARTARLAIGTENDWGPADFDDVAAHLLTLENETFED